MKYCGRKERKRPRFGDLLELSSSHGFAYVQYLGKDAEYGDAIFVFPIWHKQRPAVFAPEFFKDEYRTCCPVRAAVRQGLLEIVAMLPPLELLPLAAFRCAVHRVAMARYWHGLSSATAKKFLNAN